MTQVVRSHPATDESALPENKQVHQEQSAEEPVSFERTQQLTVENIVHVPPDPGAVIVKCAPIPHCA